MCLLLIFKLVQHKNYECNYLLILNYRTFLLLTLGLNYILARSQHGNLINDGLNTKEYYTFTLLVTLFSL